jgi:hypothetical protein
MKHLFRRFAGFATLGLVLAIGMSGMAQAAAPTGADWFQLLTNQQTGSDNTGDGNTGNGSDLNYYYVGQTFTSVMQIRSTGPGSRRPPTSGSTILQPRQQPPCSRQVHFSTHGAARW